jgi:hypothetical protein
MSLWRLRYLNRPGSSVILLVLVALSWPNPGISDQLVEVPRSERMARFLHSVGDCDLATVTAMLKATPSLASTFDGLATALHCAAYAGQRDIAEVLLNSRADVNAKNKYGETPLHSAADRGFRGIAELLLAHRGGC